MTPASVRNYLSGVKFLHIALGHEFPLLKEFAIRVTLGGVDRIVLHCPVRAPPVTPHIFKLVQHSFSPDSSPEEITIRVPFCLPSSCWPTFLILFQFLCAPLILINIYVGGT